MDILKKLLSGLFKVVLLVSVFLLLLSFSVGGILKDGISSVVNSNLVQVPEFEQLGIDGEKVIEFVESEEVKNFVMEYVDPMLGGEIDIENVNIGEDILEFVTTNKSKIEEIVGEPIDIAKVEEFVSSEEMIEINEQYKQTISQTSGVVPVEVKNMVHVYGFFVTNQFRILMAIISAVAIGFIMIIDKSLHTWMKSVGKTLAGCGVLIGVFILVGSNILMKVLEAFEFGVITVDYKNGLTCAIVSLVVGIILLVIYSKVERNIRERSILNEMSTVSK